MAKELVRVADQKAIEGRIHVIRGKHVILDSDLAEFYEVPTGRLTRQVKTNPDRFPKDFAFQLTQNEWDSLRSENRISKKGRGGRRYAPYAFTELGALQASSVLRSGKAAEVSVAVARAFVEMRQQLHTMEGLPSAIEAIHDKLEELEESDADLNAKVEMIGEMVKELGHAVKALNKAEKQMLQLESADKPKKKRQRSS